MIKSCSVDKPANILDVVNQKLFIELNTAHDEYIKCCNYYEWYYSIAKRVNPKSYFEIGVRLGYSMGVVISASPNMEYVEGWDNESYTPNSIQMAEKNIRDTVITDKITLNLLHKDSQLEKTPPSGFFDLVHIDGDHRPEGVYHDICLVMGCCRICMIDDYYNTDTAKGINKFIKDHSAIIKNSTTIDTVRGMCVLEF